MASEGDADARLRPPRISAGLIARPRLLARLDEAWDALVVHAPAGSGKTTLASSWLERADARVLWFDADGSLEREVPSVLRSRDDAIVVIDRAERLSPEDTRAIGTALDRGRGTRLILLTRSASTAPLLLGATGQTVLIIDPPELLADDDEIRAILSKPADADVRDAVSTTARLMAPLRDAAEQGDQTLLRFRAQLLADLDRRDGSYRASLARLAIVQSVDAELAAELGIDAAHLSIASEDGLGAMTDGWLDITAFAAAALEPLGQALDPETRETISATALSTLRLQIRRPYEALRLAMAAGDYTAASDVIQRTGFGIMDEPGLARRALAGVGYAQIKNHSLLVILTAQLANLDRATRLHGITLFGRAIARIGSGAVTARPRESLGFRVLAATLMRFTPLADQALKRSVRALAELEKLDEVELGALEVVGAQILGRVGRTAMASADDELAATMYERSYGLLVGLNSPEQLDPLSLRAALAAGRGELVLARELVDIARTAEWPRNWRYRQRGQGLELALAILDLEAGDPNGALEHLTATGPIADLLEHWTSFATAQAWRDALAGEPVQGVARIRAVRAHRSRTPTTSAARARMVAAEAMLLLASGDAVEARDLAAGAAKHVPEGLLQLARAQFATGRTSEAGASLARLARKPLSPRIALDADLLTATIALRGGELDAGDTVTVRIAGLVQSSGMRLPLYLLDAEDRERLIASAQRIGDEPLGEALEATRPAGRPAIRLEVPRLTPREQAILSLLDETSSTGELASRLFVSVNTVKTQLRLLYRKLDVGSREQALSRAIALGLINPDHAAGDDEQARTG